MESWTRLSIYESTDLVKELFKKRHARELNTGKALEITSAIAQGREYFDAASNAGLLVKPVLQYYGVLALSRGLILLLSPLLREAALPQAHGLSSNGWGENLTKNQPGKLSVEVTKGTFLSLIEATGNKDTTQIFTGPYPSTFYTVQWSPVPLGTRFSFEDILARAPELRIIFEKAFCKSALNFRAFAFTLPPHLTDIDIFPGAYDLPSDELLREYFKIPPGSPVMMRNQHNFTHTNGHACYRIEHPPQENWVTLLPKMENTSNTDVDRGEISVIAPYANDIHISKLSRYFLLAFFLGTLSRYHPTHWLGIMQGRQTGDFIMPLIRDIMNRIQNDYCRLIIRELED